MKRLFDIVFSLFALILLAPIMFFVAVSIKLISPKGSVVFVQRRQGLYGKEFQMYKFRTMHCGSEDNLNLVLESNSDLNSEYTNNFKLKNDPRVIPIVGNFLRKSSLDEIPQLFNVLKGDMTLIGPRPYLYDELVSYDKEKKLILTKKPGITGLWQVSGRNDLSFQKRVELDLEYVYKQSFLIDMKIFLKTFIVIFTQKGAY